MIRADAMPSVGIAADSGRATTRGTEGRRMATAATAAAVALLPLLIPSGPGNTAPADVLIAVAVATVLWWAGSGGHPVRVPYGMALALFMASGILGAMTGPVPTNGLLAVLQDGFLLLWCAAIANLGRTAPGLLTIVRVWTGSAVLWAAWLVGAFLTGHPELAGVDPADVSRASLTFKDPNVAANYFFLAIMLIWATRPWNRRITRIAGIVVLVTAMFLSGSNGGLLALVAGVALTSGLALFRRAGLLPAVAAGSVGIAATAVLVLSIQSGSLRSWAGAAGQPLIKNSVGRIGTSTEDRGGLVRASLELYRDGPLLGSGPASTLPRLEDQLFAQPAEAHNDYLAALVERGVLGALALAALIAAILGRTWSVLVGPLSASFSTVARRPEALAGAVVGLLIAGALYEVLHFRHVWAFLGVLAAVHLWGRR
jgi:O-antigen ligase